MAKFKFIGQFTGDSEVIDMFGYKFAGDKPVDVPDTDEATIEKLRGNAEFEEIGGGKDKADNTVAAKRKSAEAASKVEGKRLADEAEDEGEDEPVEPGVTARNMDQVGRQEAAASARVMQDGKPGPDNSPAG